MAAIAGMREKLAMGALAWAFLTVVWFGSAALGSKYGLWSWQFGLGQMVGSVAGGFGRYVLAVSILLAVVALILGLVRSPRVRPVILSLAALLITLLVGGRWMGFQLTALSLPPIHQAATDWDDPIAFSSNLMAAREAGGALNPVVDSPIVTLSEGAQSRWPGFHDRPIGEVQEEAEQDPALGGDDDDTKPYPPMDTLVVDMAQTDAFDLVLAAVEAEGWAIVGANHEAGRIEATHTSPWFGFEDDVAFRIRALDTGGTEIDMRSVSRVGLSDLGANARRVSAFMADLKRDFAAANS